MTALLRDALLTTAIYFLLARAEITRFLWSRYPKSWDKLVLCPACSGWWIGCVLAGMAAPASLKEILLGGMQAMVITPIVFGAMRWGMSTSDAES